MDETIQNWIVDVSEEDFQAKVIDASRQRLVVVDFWAAWCGPCLALAPILERLAEEFQGAIQIARVNTEEEPVLAQRFGIRGIPALILFRDGTPVEELVGLSPENELRKIFLKHRPSLADPQVKKGREHLRRGEFSEAEGILRQALEQDPGHAEARVALAEAIIDLGRLDEAGEVLAELPPAVAASEEAEALQTRLRLLRQSLAAGGLEAAKKYALAQPGDSEAQYQYALALAAERRYEDALEILLGLVRKDRSFRDDGARKAMLEIFRVIGVRSPLADAFRDRLSRVIF